MHRLRVDGLKRHKDLFFKKAEDKIDFSNGEYNIRIAIQDLLKELKLERQLDVMFDGNSVYPLILIDDLRKFLNEPSYDNFTPSIYEFFHLCCGTSAHYSRQGWYSTYTIPDIKQILRDALKIQPRWAGDRIRILKAIVKELD